MICPCPCLREGSLCADYDLVCLDIDVEGVTFCPDVIDPATFPRQSTIHTGELNGSYGVPLCGGEGRTANQRCLYLRSFCDRAEITTTSLVGAVQIANVVFWEVRAWKQGHLRQVLSFASTPLGGTFKLNITGHGTTSALATTVSAADMQTALNALPGIGGAAVTGSYPSWTIEFNPTIYNPVTNWFLSIVDDTTFAGLNIVRSYFNFFYIIGIFGALRYYKVGCCCSTVATGSVITPLPPLTTTDTNGSCNHHQCVEPLPVAFDFNWVFFSATKNVPEADILDPIAFTNTLASIASCPSSPLGITGGYGGTATVQFHQAADSGGCPPFDNDECEPGVSPCEEDCYECHGCFVCPTDLVLLVNFILNFGLCDDCESGCCVDVPIEEIPNPPTIFDPLPPCGVELDKDECLANGHHYVCSSQASFCNRKNVQTDDDLELPMTSFVAGVSMTFSLSLSILTHTVVITVTHDCVTGLWGGSILIDGRCEASWHDQAGTCTSLSLDLVGLHDTTGATNCSGQGHINANIQQTGTCP